MEKYRYKNTHFFATMDPKRIIKMSFKVLYAIWGPTACYSMTFAGLYTALSRKVVGKIVHATIPKGNMGYDQYTVPDTVAVEPK